MMTSTDTSDTSKMHIRDMGAMCEFCAGRSFRRSRFQAKDVMALLIMRYPVRCLSCSKRQAVSVMVARRAVSSRVKQVRAPHGGDAMRRAETAESGPVTVGGRSFSALTIQAPVVMPELSGVRLGRVDSRADEDESRIA